MATEAPLASPRLETLRQEVAAGNAAALELFWQELSQQGAPLIEPIPGDDQYSLVTLVWRAPEEIQSVAVVSNLNGQMGASEAMARWPGTGSLLRVQRRAHAVVLARHAGGWVAGPAGERHKQQE